ncbi:MAG TPA: polysaccharide deacetylase [Clostridiales bacterium]|nr:polysaccharide deacetylase [Clostridiales bacterium]
MGKTDSNEKNGKQQLKKVFLVIGAVVILLLVLGFYWFLNSIWPGKNGSKGKAEQTLQTIQTTPEGTTPQTTPEGAELTPGGAAEGTTPGDMAEGTTQEGASPGAENPSGNTDNKSFERQELLGQAERLALGYDYEGALSLIKSYGEEAGAYKQYAELSEAYERLEEEKETLVLYGGAYTSITQINHIFFHSLVADNSKAFDGDRRSRGYNMYMTTIPEFNRIIDKMYRDGYVLVKMADLVKKETLEDGTTRYVENPIYLRQGKKPFILSQDDVNYYSYMDGDGFATRIVIGGDGKPACEMLQEDGTTTTGAFDIVPILDAFIEEHPDFSYKGAKGLLALTGYEGILGYRTNDETSPTYEKDKEDVMEVVKVLKEEGWEFASHSWGHKDMYAISYELLKRDTDRWLKEVAPLIGGTDILVFPFGIDIEKTVGSYGSDKYKYLKEQGFDVFVGVYKEPWMQIKKDYVRMTRRPLDGQAMLQFPERLEDLFDVKDILDPERPPRDW